MKDYEIVFILKPTFSEEKYAEIISNFEGWVTKNGGEILLLTALGLRDLAQQFGHFTQGYYVQSHFKAVNQTLEEIQRQISVSEDFLRHLVVTLESITVHKRGQDELQKSPVGE